MPGTCFRQKRFVAVEGCLRYGMDPELKWYGSDSYLY